MASQVPGAVSPGELITVIGSAIGPPVPVYPGGNSVAAGSAILFDGTPAPILYADPNEIRAIVPFEVSGQATKMQVVTINGLTALSLAVGAASPGLFTADGSGVGQGAILNQDSTLNSPASPATAGSVVVLYATGAGQTNPPSVDGAVTGDTSSEPILPVAVEIGGVNAQVLYAGAAPGLISGVLQINCRIPQGLPSNPATPVTLRVGNLTSAAGVTVAIQ